MKEWELWPQATMCPIYASTIACVPVVDPPHLPGFVARVMELTSTHSRWHRGLWRGGTLELADEFLEDCIRPGTFPKAISDDSKALLDALQKDHGIPDHGGSVRGILKSIDSVVDPGTHAWVGLQHHVSQMHDTYLTNWATAISNPSNASPLDTEGAARRITGHILASGMHKSSLYQWLRALEFSTDTVELVDFLQEADSRIKSPLRKYTFCVPISKRPPTTVFDRSDSTDDLRWLRPGETTSWRDQYAPEAKTVRHQGAFVIKVEARDVNSAAEMVREHLANLEIKFELGSRRDPIRTLPVMWSKEKGSDFPTKSTKRSISITSFDRLGRLHDLTMADYLANTIALVAPLRTGAPHLAVVSGWATIESLLVGPSDTDIVAAQRFSTILAASLMRAEFTWLAKQYAKENSDAISSEISSCQENIDKAKAIQRAAFANPNLSFCDATDQMALQRIRPALTNPSREIKTISEILTREFVRLYRKRNTVVHSGRIGGLRSITDTLTPLIGEGVDRIVHAQLKFGTPPISLSAIADARVDYLRPVSLTDSGGLLDLLEQD